MLFVSLAATFAMGHAVLPWEWPGWDRIPTFTYGTNTSCCNGSRVVSSCCSGIDSASELKWKLQYDLAMIDNDLTTPACLSTAGTGGHNWTSCNDFRMDRAAEIKALDPKKPVFVYRGGPAGCGSSMTDTKAAVEPDETWFNWITNTTMTRGETWLKDATGTLQPYCDFRKKSAQDWWLTQMVFGPDKRLTTPHYDGIFSDSGLIMGFAARNVTVGTRRELFNGTARAMQRMAAHLAEHGKVLTFSLKDHFSLITHTGGGSSGGTLCDPHAAPTDLATEPCFPYGEEVLFEIMGATPWVPFREFNIPSRDFGKANASAMPWGCAAAVEDFAVEASKGPAIACNNDGTLNKTLFPSPYGPISWFNQHEMSLAAFMMGMQEGSYFGSGNHWDDPGWHVWWPEYDKPLGKPLGAYTRAGFKFVRRFEHLTVSADCSTLQTQFDWH